MGGGEVVGGIPHPNTEKSACNRPSVCAAFLSLSLGGRRPFSWSGFLYLSYFRWVYVSTGMHERMSSFPLLRRNLDLTKQPQKPSIFSLFFFPSLFFNSISLHDERDIIDDGDDDIPGSPPVRVE